MPNLVFSHANGFPAATYRRLFTHWREAGWSVHAVERFGHDPRHPVTSNWPHLIEQLTRFVERQAPDGACLVGHSLGGFLSLMVACHRPDLARAVVLLDSPLIAGWKAQALRLAKTTGLVRRVSPGRVSQRRRMQWASRDEALAHFQSKPAFARWHPQVLHDYIDGGTVQRAGRCELAFQRDVETTIYNTLPHHIEQLVRRHPPRCPVMFVGGTHSQEVRQVGMRATETLTHGRISWLEGSHLFPFERPDETASQVDALLHQHARAHAPEATGDASARGQTAPSALSPA